MRLQEAHFPSHLVQMCKLRLWDNRCVGAAESVQRVRVRKAQSVSVEVEEYSLAFESELELA